MEDGSLRILGAIAEDSGMYQCMARNDRGALQLGTRLLVSSAQERATEGEQQGGDVSSQDHRRQACRQSIK